MSSIMNDSFDEAIANMEMPQDPGPLADNKATGDKPDDEMYTPQTNSTSSSMKAAVVTTTKNVDNNAATSSASSIVPATKYSPNAIQVNPNQKGNPLLKAITTIPYEYNNEILADYVVGQHACVLFLSIRYHNLKPDYLNERLKKLGKKYCLRVLLVQVDTKEPHNTLKHLTRICLLADLTLMLAWSSEEAGKIIETYKMLEFASAEKLQEKPECDSHSKIVNALTSIRTVNKTDAATLLVNFGTLQHLIEANENKLNTCVGLGPRKQEKLMKLFNEPFLK